MQLLAPAKINLSFKILVRRADSFHEIESLMAPISLCDSLAISPSETDGEVQFVCDDPALPTGNDNLVVRAARSFLQAIDDKRGVRIELQKKIPHGAGLGGGSSDAAATLLGLNQFCGSGWSEHKLAQLAAGIGSDVPFFVFRSAAHCRGRGELVTPGALSVSLPLLLLKPAFGVPTPWAYGRWKESKELSGIDYRPQEFAGFTLVNHLERPVFEKYVFLAETKMWLLAQKEVGAAMMSGSGATVFAILHAGADGEQLAARAKAELDPELWTCACETQ